jgi:hypothetical protein
VVHDERAVGMLDPAPGSGPVAGMDAPESALEAFPHRPIQVIAFGDRAKSRGAVKTVLGWTLCCLWFVLMPLWLFWSLQFLWDDYRLRDSGTVTRSASVSNYSQSYRTRSGGGGVDFDLSYVTQEGTRYTRHVALYSSPDRTLPIVVRYDPASPTHFSTNWSANLLFSRTLGLSISVVLVLLTALGAFVSMREKRRAWRRNRSMQRSPQADLDIPMPVETSLVKTGAPNQYGFADIQFVWSDDTGRSATGTTTFGAHQEPFWLDRGKTRMLALVWPSGHALLLDSALASVDLTNAERRRIVGRRDIGLGRKRGEVPAAASALRQGAEVLSSALREIVSGLLSEVPAHPAALGIVSRLGPLVASYHRAVYQTRSRDDAVRALELIADPMTDVIAASNEGMMHFGNALKTYSDLKNLFRDSNNRDDSL